MFRFTIRDVLGLTVIGAISCVLGAIAAVPDDPVSAFIATAEVFGWGGLCYVAGIALGRTGTIQPATLNRP